MCLYAHFARLVFLEIQALLHLSHIQIVYLFVRTILPHDLYKTIVHMSSNLHTFTEYRLVSLPLTLSTKKMAHFETRTDLNFILVGIAVNVKC